MNHRRIALILLSCIVLSSTVFQISFATLGVWTSRISWLNFSGSSDAESAKMVRKLQSIPPKWAADIASYTDNPPIVITLGWRYFSATEFCDGEPVENIQGGQESVQNDEIASTIFVQTHQCSGTRHGRSSGNHEFIYGQTVTDDWSKTEEIP